MASDDDTEAITMSEEQEQQYHHLVDWTKKQGRILTAGGRAEEYYTAERGFAYQETELPHHYLLQQTTCEVFREWRREDEEKASSSPIGGPWKRGLFYGGWEHSTDRDEYSFNLQTQSLFIDLRIPCTRNRLISLGQQAAATTIQSLDDLSAQQLRWYARQHVFAGYSRLSPTHQQTATINNNKFDACCARHHCIDWNFVGKGRTRPNKWWIDLIKTKTTTTTTTPAPANAWKEWAYATDEHGQHYYCERWERLEEGAPYPVLALRKSNAARDGVLIVVGDHFNYCLDRQVDLELVLQGGHYENCASLVDLVDTAIDQNDLTTARAWLGLQGGHGLISQGWMLDHCIEFWREGHPLWQEGEVEVQGDSIENAKVIWDREEWDVFESSLTSIDDLRELFASKPQKE